MCPGKAISIRAGLPHISIRTTYAGSEMTMILGRDCYQSKDNTCQSGSDTMDGNLRSQPDRALPIKLSAISELKFDGSCKLVVSTPLLHDFSLWESRG
jgi:hypothetical protein